MCVHRMCSIAFWISPALITPPSIIASSSLRTLSSPVAPEIVCGITTQISETTTVTSLSFQYFQSFYGKICNVIKKMSKPDGRKNKNYQPTLPTYQDYISAQRYENIHKYVPEGIIAFHRPVA